MAGGEEGASSLHIPSTILTEFLLVALIISSLILEFLLHRIERWVAMRHLHLQAVLRNLYRELMVLGLVSFIFISYEAIAHPDSETVGSFEFAHIFIFLLAIVHTFVVLATVATSLRLSYRWRGMEQMELVRYLELKEQYRRSRSRRQAHHGFFWRRFQWWLPDPRALLRYWRLHEIMAFHDIRFQFLYYRDLPEDFNFSAFLRKVKAVIFIDLVDIHWSLRLVFLAIVVIDVLRRNILESNSVSESKFEPVFAIFASASLSLVATLLTFKISRVHWALSKHPATYFDQVSKEEAMTVVTPPPDGETLQLGAAKVPAASDADDERTDVAGVSPVGAAGGPSLLGANPDSCMADNTVLAALLSPEGVERGDGRPGASESASGVPTKAVTPSVPSPLSRLSVDVAPSFIDKAGIGGSPTSYEPPRITNLVYSDNLEGASGGGYGSDSKRRPNAKRKPKRIVEPPPASALDLAQVAEKHSLRTEGLTGRRSVDVGRGNSDRLSADRWANGRRSLDGASRTSFDSRPSVRRSLDGQPNARRSLDSRLSGGSGRSVAPRPCWESSPAVNNTKISNLPSVADKPNATLASSIVADADLVGAAASGWTEKKLMESSSDAVVSSVLATFKPSRESRPVGADDSRRRSLESARFSVERKRRSLDGGDDGAGAGEVGGVIVGAGRRVDISEKLPVNELAGRADGDAFSGSLAHAVLDLDPDPENEYIDVGEKSATSTRLFTRSSREYGRQSGDTRGRDGEKMNHSIVKHAEDRANAGLRAEPGNYPKLVLFFCPRLQRRASRAEQLFWFGSHRFFRWMVEAVLFFSTVLFAATVAAVALLTLRPGSGERERKVDGLAVASVICSGCTLMYVLIRISYVMKKYAFVLNSASLVPEVVALSVIHNVHQKRQLRSEVYATAGDDASGSEDDGDHAEAARERRRKIFRFFATDAEQSGHIPGAAELGVEEKKSFVKSLSKRIGFRRPRRKRAPAPDIPLLPLLSNSRSDMGDDSE